MLLKIRLMVLLCLAYIEAAESIFEKDVKTNKSIGDHGAKRILELTGRKRSGC